jgi:hypothetical protein
MDCSGGIRDRPGASASEAGLLRPGDQSERRQDQLGDSNRGQDRAPQRLRGVIPTSAPADGGPGMEFRDASVRAMTSRLSLCRDLCPQLIV